VGVRIGAAHVIGDRALQMLGRPEAEVAGVADIELDQLAALGLQLPRSSRQFAPDLVADFGQALAGGERLQRGRGHERAVIQAWKPHGSGIVALQGKRFRPDSAPWQGGFR